MAGIIMAEGLGLQSAACENTKTTCLNSVLVSDEAIQSMAALLNPCESDFNVDEESDGECSATVADADRCVGDMIAGYRTAISTMSCDTIEDFAEPAEPASCVAMEQKCPAMADDDDYDY